jgi:hypothetical protein
MRRARLAATFLRGLMHEPAWLREVAVEVVDGTPVVLVLLKFDDALARRCVPSKIEGISVSVRVVG